MKLPVVISYFYCEECESEWRIFRNHPWKASECTKSQCSNYGIKIRNYFVQWVNQTKSDIRCCGHFSCGKCENDWWSSYTWILYTQKCLNCNYRKNYPDLLYELKSRDSCSYVGGRKHKHHKREYCTKCLEVGDCRKYTPYYVPYRNMRDYWDY